MCLPISPTLNVAWQGIYKWISQAEPASQGYMDIFCLLFYYRWFQDWCISLDFSPFSEFVNLSESLSWVSQVAWVVKESACQCRRLKRCRFNPWLKTIPDGIRDGGWHGNPLQYSCLENPTDRGTWWATAQRVAKSRTLLKCLSMQ